MTTIAAQVAFNVAVLTSDSTKLGRLKFILEFDLTPYLEGNGGFVTAEMADKAQYELRRYFALKVLGYSCSMSFRMADIVWHNLILHTAAYRKFCSKAFGQFLDHLPGKFNRKPMSQSKEECDLCAADDDGDDGDEISAKRENPREKQTAINGQDFIKIYQQVFNETPDTKLWR